MSPLDSASRIFLASKGWSVTNCQEWSWSRVRGFSPWSALTSALTPSLSLVYLLPWNRTQLEIPFRLHFRPDTPHKAHNYLSFFLLVSPFVLFPRSTAIWIVGKSSSTYQPQDPIFFLQMINFFGDLLKDCKFQDLYIKDFLTFSNERGFFSLQPNISIFSFYRQSIQINSLIAAFKFTHLIHR